MNPVKKPLNDGDDEAPGVPGFRTWRGIYLCVGVCFVVVVALLTLFTHLAA